MEGIKSLIKLPPVKKGPTSERAELIGFFTRKLNATRDGRKYKKLSPAAVAVKLSHLKALSDLHFLKSECENAERRGFSFSKRFWWSIKPQSHD